MQQVGISGVEFLTPVVSHNAMLEIISSFDNVIIICIKVNSVSLKSVWPLISYMWSLDFMLLQLVVKFTYCFNIYFDLVINIIC